MPTTDRSFSGPELPQDSTAMEFEQVTMRVFPLRANLFALEKFCDNYLNIAPQITRFRPVVPFVFLAAINYPKMSQAASNLGWVSQNEVVFSVPVEWQRAEDSRWVQDWASVSPYLFVDNERSIQVGREVYGWPKVLADFRPGSSRWTANPRSHRRLLNLETPMFSKLYAGQPLEPRTILEIEHVPAETLLRFPPDFENLFSPTLKWPRIAIDSMFQFWEAIPEAANLMNWVRPAIEALASGNRAPCANTINLKQFRSSESAGGDRIEASACYQALVNAKMQFMKYHGSGFLGDIEMLRGDPTGGFRILLHRNSSYPIVESLGLQVSEDSSSGEDSTSTLELLLPFWVAADVRYLPGERICWRAEGHDWSTDDSLGPLIPGEPDRPAIPYLTSLGPVAQPIEGPFDFWDATLRLVPLRAKKKTLLTFVHKYLERLKNDDRIAKVEVLERGGDALVLLVVSTYGKLSAPANDIGWWARRQLAFTVPVVVTPKKVTDKNGNLIRDASFPALFWPYVFNDSPIAVSTGREFTGMPSEYAIFADGVDPWLALEWGEKRNLMTLSTYEYPALGVGQPAEERVLLEVVEGPEIKPFPAPTNLPNLKFSQQTAGISKTSAGLPQPSAPIDPSAGGFVVTGLYLDNILLKQFRDAEDPGLACYQAVVVSRTEIGRWQGRDHAPRFHPSDRDYEVRIHDYQSRPIAKTLGLIADEEELRDDGTRVTVHRTRSDTDGIGPVWLRADLRHQSGQPLFWRAISGDWQEVEGAWKTIEESAQEDSGIRTLEDFLDALMKQATIRTTLVVHFEPNEPKKDAVPKNRKPYLDRIARAMAEKESLRVEVTGYCDSAGNEKSNLALSQRRAESIKKYLANKGVTGDRIRTEGVGEEQPVGDNETEDGRGANRRAEIVVRIS